MEYPASIRWLRPILVWLCPVLFIAFPACADEASKVAKIEEYFRLSRLQQTMEASMRTASQQMNTQMLSQITGARMPKELEADFEVYQERIVAVLEEALSWEVMKPEYIRMHLDVFTEEDLDGIVAFYRSPVGQRFVEQTPQLMSRAYELSQRRLVAIAPRLRELNREWNALVRQRMGSPPAAGNTPVEP